MREGKKERNFVRIKTKCKPATWKAQPSGTWFIAASLHSWLSPDSHTESGRPFSLCTLSQTSSGQLWNVPCPLAFARLFAESSHLPFCGIFITLLDRGKTPINFYLVVSQACTALLHTSFSAPWGQTCLGRLCPKAACHIEWDSLNREWTSQNASS